MSYADAQARRVINNFKTRKGGHWIEFNGQRKRLSEWAKEVGINQVSMSRRIESGWPIEKAFTTGRVSSETQFGGVRDPRAG